MSTGFKLSEPGEGTTPLVLNIPTFGHPVRLGELYDQRAGNFLGVQLYAEDKLEVVETNINHSDLTFSRSTTLEQKADSLDIFARITLNVLAGIISVTGSASYLKDTKSNTNVQAFAMALKMRLKEKRVLFAEEKLGRNILDIVSQDYINPNSATHFVSSIVYGGNIIVNLVSRQSELESDEKIEGKLEAKFNALLGIVSLKGEAKVGVREQFKSMDNKFDLVVHGDVTLDQVPINPQDVLKTIPEGAKLIQEGGGVPITCVLQPIPEALFVGSKVHEIDELFIDIVMKAFSPLDDLRSRFDVLVGAAKPFEEFAPELVRVVRIASAEYTEKHGSLLYDLRNFLIDYQHGKPLAERWKPDDPDDTSEHIPVLTDARRLYNYNLELLDEDDGGTEKSLSQYYPSTLVGLEGELLKFQNFSDDIQSSKDVAPSLADASKDFVTLSTLDDINKAVRLHRKMPLFIMPPFKMPNAESGSDIPVIQFVTILRNNIQYFNMSNHARILYVETLEALERRLPNLFEKFVKDGKNPALVIGEVGTGGILEWTDPPLMTTDYVDVRHEPSGGKRGKLVYDVTAVNGKRSFTIQIRGRPTGFSDTDSVICVLKTKSNKPFLQFQMEPLGVLLHRNFDPTSVPIESSITPLPGRQFVATFIQDVEAFRWILYFEEREVDRVDFTGVAELLNDSENVQLVFADSDDVNWWDGDLFETRAFSFAFTQEKVEAEMARE